MKVLVNALSAQTGGGITYLVSLLDAALAADSELRLVLVLPGRGGPLASLGLHDRVEIKTLARAVPLPVRLLWEQTRLSALARRSGAHVLFAPAELAPIRSSVPVVVGFQNPNLYARPCPFPLPQRLRLDALLRAARFSARNAAALVFVSEPFRREALAVLGVSPARAHVVSPGVHRAFYETSMGPSPFDAFRPFVLSVSDVYAYKNFPFLVSAFARVRETRPDLRLVIAGRPVHADAAAAIRDRIRQLGLESAVVLLGGVPFRDMPSLYRSAECFAFPSLLESYGFPPLEAMACGVPVACSNASVMPEVCGEAAAYFDPTDVADCARAVGDLLGDTALGSALVERGRLRAAAATWDAAGESLVRVFQEVAR